MKGFLAIVLPVVLCIYPTFGMGADPASEASAPAPNYFPALKQELARLQTAARCNDVTMVCTAEIRPAPDAEPTEVTVRYSRTTDTVYAFIDKFITIPRGQSPSAELMLELLSLNAELVASKFEWQVATNAFRLSTVMSCDADFDRRAFRSQYTGLLKVAEKLHAELAGDKGGTEE